MSPSDVAACCRQAQGHLGGVVSDLLHALAGLTPGSVLAREIEASIDDCVRARRNLDRFTGQVTKP